jgi:hypothetical protein
MRIIEVKRIVGLLSVSVMVASNILLFGPFNIYQGNITEFDFSFFSTLSDYMLPFFVFSLTVFIIGLLLPQRIYKQYVTVLVAIGVLLYLQGNFFVWDYGLFGAGDIDFNEKLWRGWIDCSVWIVVLIVSFVYYKIISRRVLLISIILFTVQFVVLVYTIIQNPIIIQANKDISELDIPHEKVLQFSSKQNIIHIIPDCLQSTVFKEIIDSNPGHYYETFKGFTFFSEATGTYPTTFFSIPAFLSSRRYRNDMPMMQYLDSGLKGKNILSVLQDNGYEIDLVTLKWYEKAPSTFFFDIPYPYNASIQKRRKLEAETILKWVCLRYLPHFLKGYYFYGMRGSTPARNAKQDLDPNNPQHQSTLADRVRLYSIANKDFLKDIVANSSIDRNKPVYKFLHVHQIHWPFFMTSDCKVGQILPSTWKNVKNQAKCSVDEIVEVLEKIKALGIYDSSLIVINADHGYPAIPNSLEYFKSINLEKQLDSRANGLAPNKEAFAQILSTAVPTMLIKPPYCEGPLKISNAQVELTDIPDTIASIMKIREKFKGRSVYEVDPDIIRERRYFFYERHPPKRTETNYCTKITEYIIKGSVFNPSSWWRCSIFIGPDDMLSFQTKKVDFGSDNVVDFLISGWGGNERNSKDGLTFNWALGSSASIYINLPKSEAVILTANMKTLRFRNDQNITIKVDGNEIGDWALSASWKWEKHSIVIEPDENRPDVSVVEFVFSQHKEPDEKDKRALAVLFESITLSEFKDKDKG